MKNTESIKLINRHLKPRERNEEAKASFINRMTQISPDIEILGEYVNTKEKVRVKCKICGYEWASAPGNLLEGHGCNECKRLSMFTTDEGYYKKAEKANPGIKFLSEYKGFKNPIKARLSCGHETTLIARSFYVTRECVICKNSQKHHDEDGNSFSSIADLCKAHGISRTSYYNNLNKGKTGKDAYTKTKGINSKMGKASKECEDHLGNHFGSVKEMCAFYNINPSTFHVRIFNGFTLKEALTSSKNCQRKIDEESRTDHLGNIFNSIADMCRHYKLKYSTYISRRRNGWTKERALLTSA